MSGLEQIRSDRALVNAIDWEMTPEEAVRLYLEWGNNWAGGNYVIRSKHDVAYYFVISTWKRVPLVYLIRRNSEEAAELACLELPERLAQRFLEEVGYQKGVWAPNGDVKRWLQSQLDQN
jgi:hypothetical protein